MTNPLIVVRPVSVTDAMLISTDVTEADYAAWSAVTTYALGDRCIVTADVHLIYESLAAGNLNHDPVTDTTNWIEVSPTNRWALFDGSNSTVTTAPSGSMTYTLRPVGGINAFAALNLTGVNTVRVRLTHTTLGTVYDTTTDISSTPPDVGWWAWFFGTRTAPSLMVLTDLPGILGCDLIVDFSGTVDMSVGVVLFGEARSVGVGLLQGARVGIVDYSRKETDTWGNTVLVQRAFAKRANFSIPIMSGQVDSVIDYLATLRAIPCLWIGSGQYASSVVYGFYKAFEVVIAYSTVSDCSLDIEGMT